MKVRILTVVLVAGISSLVAGSPHEDPIASLRLEQNFPDPFNSTTTIK